LREGANRFTRDMRSGVLRTILATAFVSCAATILLLRWGMLPTYPVQGVAPQFQSASAADAKQPPLSPEEQVNVDVYNKVSPGVVNITSTVVEYDFFLTPYAIPSTGSGVVLDLNGNILTNNHVIESARTLEVALPDHTTYKAEVVGQDPKNDLAVIRLSGAPKERLHPVPLGDSSTLRVGQKVLAIGNPFRMQNTMTTGIISSLGRKIRTDAGNLIDDVIQTDAAINPGNSGGPLLNAAGEMIGINTMIISPSGSNGGNVGIGFAVPVDTARRVMVDLLKEGRVIRPDMGEEGQDITSNLASALGLPIDKGLLIIRVYRGGTAEAAGLRGASEYAILFNQRFLVGGDIITELDGKPIASQDDLDLILENKRPGDTVHLTFYRGRTKSEKSIVLMERPRTMR
jgi:S1-C subfamily serine protease